MVEGVRKKVKGERQMVEGVRFQKHQKKSGKCKAEENMTKTEYKKRG